MTNFWVLHTQSVRRFGEGSVFHVQSMYMAPKHLLLRHRHPLALPFFILILKMFSLSDLWVVEADVYPEWWKRPPKSQRRHFPSLWQLLTTPIFAGFGEIPTPTGVLFSTIAWVLCYHVGFIKIKYSITLFRCRTTKKKMSFSLTSPSWQGWSVHEEEMYLLIMAK